MDFEDFRDLMDVLYEEFNSESSIRIAAPTDQEKLHMLMAIEAYFYYWVQKQLISLPETVWTRCGICSIPFCGMGIGVVHIWNCI